MPPVPAKQIVGQKAIVTYYSGKTETVDVGRPLLIADVLDAFGIVDDEDQRPNAYRLLLWTTWFSLGRPGLNGAKGPEAMIAAAHAWLDENVANVDFQNESAGPPTKSRGKPRG